jgi:peptidyl-prolyl cis-trans isomerase D
MMQSFRNAAKPVVLLITITFLSWMIVDLSGITGNGGFLSNTSVGSVNGETIDSRIYQEAVQNATTQRGGSLGIEELEQVRNEVWESFIQNVALTSEFKRRNITVTAEEVADAISNVPPDEIRTAPDFQTDGQFDMTKYQRWIVSPVGKQYIPVLEQRYREELMRRKLLVAVTADVYLSDAALWDRYRDQKEQARIGLTALIGQSLIPDTAVAVTPAEVEAYYAANKKSFERPRAAFMSFVSVPRVLDASDSAAALSRVTAVRAEIVGGSPFAEVAARESSDGSAAQGGSLGTFARGAMVPPFDSAAFALPLNTLSQPVKTGYGYHLIEVSARTADSATARHILIPFELAGAHRDLVDAQADSLESLGAERLDPAALDTVARALRLPIGQTGPVQEGSRVLLGPYVVPDAGAWSMRAKQGETSPVIEGETAFYVFRLDSIAEAGTPTLASIRGLVEREAREKKKEEKAKEMAKELVRRVKAGTSLAAASTAMGLSHREFPPFARVSPPLSNAKLVGAIFGLSDRQVSDVIETDEGLYVVEMIQRLPADTLTFEATKENLRAEAIQGMRQERVRQYLASLRASAKVVDRRDVLFKTNAQIEAAAPLQQPAGGASPF